MTAVLLAPMTVSVLLALTGARLGRRLPPSSAVRLLTITALATALSTGFVLSVAAFVALAQIHAIAALGRWSARAVAAGEPVPLILGLICGAASAGLMAAAVRHVAITGRDLAAAAVACRDLGVGASGLVILHDDVPDAYALPGLRGRVVVSTAMLKELPAQERRVLLAHEMAHLRHRHHLYVLGANLSAAANPLLRPIAAAVREGVERWADEEAAAVAGDRHTAAQALARASLAQHHARSAHGRLNLALGMAHSMILLRTQALLSPAPRPQRPLLVGVALLALAAVFGAVLAGHDTEQVLEVAQAAFQRKHWALHQ